MRSESRICGKGICPVVTDKVFQDSPSFPTSLDLAVDIGVGVWFGIFLPEGSPENRMQCSICLYPSEIKLPRLVALPVTVAGVGSQLQHRVFTLS